jgi:hypothetical protein
MRLSKINYNTSECLPRHLIMVNAYDGIIRNCFLFNGIANLRKKRLLVSSCLSVRPHGKLGSHWTDFHKIWYFNFLFVKFVDKIQISLKSDKNNGYFTWRRVYIHNISLNPFTNKMRLRRKVYRKSKHISCSLIYFVWKNRAGYEIVWKNIVEPDRPETIV